MKIIKIGALWCGACLITNKAWNEFKKKYPVETVELDFDLDEEEVEKYSVGKILPVFLFFSNDLEVGRLTGEIGFEDLENKYLEVGGKNE